MINLSLLCVWIPLQFSLFTEKTTQATQNYEQTAPRTGGRTEEPGRWEKGSRTILTVPTVWLNGGWRAACRVPGVLNLSGPLLLSTLASIHCKYCKVMQKLWLPVCYLLWLANKNCILGWRVEVLTYWDSHIGHLVQVPLPQIPCQIQALALSALWNLLNPVSHLGHLTHQHIE